MSLKLSIRMATTAILLLPVSLSGCQRAQLAISLAQYERTLDAYAQTDTTVTDVTASEDRFGRKAELVSAFFGLDNALPDRISNKAVCKGANLKDGMPVIFSHEIDASTIEPGDFRVVTESGAVGEVTCLTLAPADDPGELRTVLLAGDYGSADDEPVRVEIVGNVLSIDGSLNFKGAELQVTPLEAGPTIVWAEIVPKDLWELGGSATNLVFGGGSRCPVGTEQVVRVTWNGGITKPGGDPADDEERRLYVVSVAQPGGGTDDVTPFALADLNDGDNNHLLCLDTAAEVVSVFFPAGHLTDPREDLNPATRITL